MSKTASPLKTAPPMHATDNIAHPRDRAWLRYLGAHELRSRTPDGSTGNFGQSDQRLALRWVPALAIDHRRDSSS
eukprot:COSAG01_NODE_3453_length_6077_cov_8.916527_6_plen_75_part_00